MLFKNILVPVDGSPASLQAVASAVSLAKAYDGTVTAIYVIDPYPFTGVGTDFAYGQTQYLSAARAEASAALAAAREAMEAVDIKVTGSLVESHSTWRGILEAAETGGVDLIVMGSHGRSGIEKMVLGSVAQRVVSHASVAVMVVRG